MWPGRLMREAFWLYVNILPTSLALSQRWRIIWLLGPILGVHWPGGRVLTISEGVRAAPENDLEHALS